jgi:hypothetical protein
MKDEDKCGTADVWSFHETVQSTVLSRQIHIRQCPFCQNAYCAARARLRFTSPRTMLLVDPWSRCGPQVAQQLVILSPPFPRLVRLHMRKQAAH